MNKKWRKYFCSYMNNKWTKMNDKMKMSIRQKSVMWMSASSMSSEWTNDMWLFFLFIFYLNIHTNVHIAHFVRLNIHVNKCTFIQNNVQLIVFLNSNDIFIFCSFSFHIEFIFCSFLKWIYMCTFEHSNEQIFWFELIQICSNFWLQLPKNQNKNEKSKKKWFSKLIIKNKTKKNENQKKMKMKN